MAFMLSKTLLKNLYEKRKLSMAQIAHRLEVSPNTIADWMQRYQIKRRSISEAIYVLNNPNGDPFKIKMTLDDYEKFLIGLGLGLFWGEGTQKSSVGVRLGNTNPFIILYFREFLERICGVPRVKIKYSLQLFGDVNRQKAICFWCDILSVKSTELKVSMVVLRGKGTYKEKNQFGVMQIACYNKKLKGVIDTFLLTLKISSYADVAQLVEHVHGETRNDLAQMLGNQHLNPE